jgi:hypothetical protein
MTDETMTPEEVTPEVPMEAPVAPEMPVEAPTVEPMATPDAEPAMPEETPAAE